MNDLERYRQQIDIIDKELIELFEKRLDVVLKVAEYKKANNSPVLHRIWEMAAQDRREKGLSSYDFLRKTGIWRDNVVAFSLPPELICCLEAAFARRRVIDPRTQSRRGHSRVTPPQWGVRRRRK